MANYSWYWLLRLGRFGITSLLIGLPTFCVATILFLRTKKLQIHVSLVLSFFWTWIGLTLGLRDVEGGFAYTVLGKVITLPVFIAAGILERLGINEVFLLFPLGFILGCLGLALPFYIHRMVSNRRNVSRENDSHDQERENA